MDLLEAAPRPTFPVAVSYGPAARDVFVARQPIFDRRKQVYGYELLFRSGLENACPPVDGDHASRDVLRAAWLDLGVDALIGQRRAFVNLTHEGLVSGLGTALPAESTVIEVLESVQPDDDVVQACGELKRAGYLLALDDFIYRPGLEPLIELADIVKIGFGECDPDEQCAHVRRVAGSRPILLAEKVETQDDLRQAVALGCRYFQGWFFCRPEIVRGRALSGARLSYLRLLHAVSQPDLEVEALTQVIGSDVALTYRFLKYLGSAAFPWRGPIRSVPHGLALLGEAQTRRWVSLMALEALAHDKPPELVALAAVRARFCDELAGRAGLADRQADWFFLGAFSLIDTILDQPMATVLAELPLAEEVTAALMGQPNALRPVLDFVEAYERGDWTRSAALCAHLQIDPTQVAHVYRTAVAYAVQGFVS